MNKNNRIYFSLNLSREQFLDFYRGHAQRVVVTAIDGRVVQFEAKHLQPFVNPHGVSGDFCIEFDHQKRFQSLVKL